MTIYQSFYDLIETYIFGSITSGSYEELVAIFFSTCASIALVALPFVVVYGIFRTVFSWGN